MDFIGRPFLLEIEEPVLPAKSTGTSAVSPFKPLPTIQQLSAKLPTLSVSEIEDLKSANPSAIL